MSNPAPTLNQINAFNATIGTTIDFNIIGGTEVIRSNKIYIYDLSDNSLICTHLYVSTESIHELPPNTSSSIVYASGKSSADFTNNTQYYAQIQTFTDTNGTQGASGLSIAKLFWCLPTPTLTLGTIPTTISTTSYNVSATYTPNTSGGATNEIQEFQFNLYSAIGALLQTSGVVLYGEGVDLSYNFSGLEVDSTYYVTLDVTTTQGMNVSAQSNTFTVSIDTPTMGSASVVNNACDGYISVTSNLSSEYSHEHSVDAGEVMSFTTDSPNDIKELQVDFHPIQDGTPWMSQTPNTAPYLFRASPQLGHSYNSKLPTIVGGSVVGNQIVGTGTWRGDTVNGVTLVSDSSTGTITVSGTATDFVQISFTYPEAKLRANRVYYLAQPNGASGSTYYIRTGENTFWSYKHIGKVETESNLASGGVRMVVQSGQTVNLTFRPQMVDLTAMLGTTIADRAYAKEQAQAGSGIAWLKSYGFISDSYVAYDTGTMQSVEATEHVTRGFNQWDGEYENGSLSSVDGSPSSDSSKYRSTNFIRVVPSTTYYFKLTSNSYVYEYDADKQFIQRTAMNTPNIFVTSANCGYIKFTSVRTGFDADSTCINLSDPSINGKYFPYEEHTYALDSDLVLRGVPKVDANDNIYYDGDLYQPSGQVDRRFGYDDLGTLDWTLHSSGIFYTPMPQRKAGATNLVCKYPVSQASTWGAIEDKTCIGNTVSGYFYIRDDSYTDAASFKTAMSGVYLVYELATTTTETTEPFTTPMLCDPSGTEEWVTDNGVPVGHQTTYADIYPISGWTGANVVVSPTLDAQDGTTYPISWQTEAGTVYGGTVDLVSGVLTVTRAIIDMGTLEWAYSSTYGFYANVTVSDYPAPKAGTHPISDAYKSATWQDDMSIFLIYSDRIGVHDSRYTDTDTFTQAVNGFHAVYELATPTTYQLTPQEIQTLVGQNNLWSDTNGEMTIMYQLPITDLLVKRKDVSQVGSQWLTLYSTPITQASDMDFTYIDFLNQYGKKYQYALVPVLAQDQSGVVVQIEGGYTVSDNVDSIFDGVYIADQTNVERVKAGVGYGNIDMNQGVGSITPIGSKYPIVITNSQNQYHNGSIRGKIVPNDFYSNGNLSRIDMVNKRDELEQFLTNKRAKIIKDWNGKMWLVMILSNVACAFDDNYGMGMVEFSAEWVEVGDPTNQQDLYNAGLINVGGV